MEKKICKLCVQWHEENTYRWANFGHWNPSAGQMGSFPWGAKCPRFPPLPPGEIVADRGICFRGPSCRNDALISSVSALQAATPWAYNSHLIIRALKEITPLPCLNRLSVMSRCSGQWQRGFSPTSLQTDLPVSVRCVSRAHTPCCLFAFTFSRRQSNPLCWYGPCRSHVSFTAGQLSCVVPGDTRTFQMIIERRALLRLLVFAKFLTHCNKVGRDKRLAGNPRYCATDETWPIVWEFCCAICTDEWEPNNASVNPVYLLFMASVCNTAVPNWFFWVSVNQSCTPVLFNLCTTHFGRLDAVFPVYFAVVPVWYPCWNLERRRITYIIGQRKCVFLNRLGYS